MTTQTPINPHDASPETTTPDLKMAWHICWDGYHACDRTHALLTIAVEYLYRLADEDGTRLSPTALGHILTSSLEQLKAVEDHLQDLETLTSAVGNASGTPRPRPSERGAWHRLRRLWATLEREDQAWVLRAARVLQEEPVERKSELTDVLTRMKTRRGSRAARKDSN